MNSTSISLLNRLQQTDDSKNWNRLVGLYAPLLRAWLRKYDVQDSDADDIVQEVLAAVLKDLPEFEHNQRTGAFRSWLRTILANRVKLFWRSEKYRPLATGTSSLNDKLNQLQDDASEASQMWNREHDEYVLKRLMKTVRAQFEHKTWQAFHRQVVDGEKADIVARELDISLSSVYMAKSRVLSALRQESEGLVDEV
jgi:RNA polymerase sigma-70 factor (ECF subfamily)